MSALRTSSYLDVRLPLHCIASVYRFDVNVPAHDLFDTTEGIQNPSRHIELDVDIGADARDWSSIQAQEKLKPVETDLRRMEELVAEIVNEMEYLRAREQKLRDTNESTNERVKWFAVGTMGMLVGLGVWQVIYLRAYFRYAPGPCVFYAAFCVK